MNTYESGHISEDAIRAIADLARLDLSESEISDASEDISNVLGNFETIRSIDTTGILSPDDVTGLPAGRQGRKNSTREDVVHENILATPDILLQNAKTKDGYVEVGAVFLDSENS